MSIVCVNERVRGQILMLLHHTKGSPAAATLLSAPTKSDFLSQSLTFKRSNYPGESDR